MKKLKLTIVFILLASTLHFSSAFTGKDKKIVFLKTFHNNNLMSSTCNGKLFASYNRKDWEQFTLEFVRNDKDGNVYYISTFHEDQLSISEDGVLCISKNRDFFEEFTFVRKVNAKNKNTYFIKSNHGKYISARNDGTFSFSNNKSSWEEFTIEVIASTSSKKDEKLNFSKFVTKSTVRPDEKSTQELLEELYNKIKPIKDKHRKQYKDKEVLQGFIKLEIENNKLEENMEFLIEFSHHPDCEVSSYAKRLIKWLDFVTKKKEEQEYIHILRLHQDRYQYIPSNQME